MFFFFFPRLFLLLLLLLFIHPFPSFSSACSDCQGGGGMSGGGMGMMPGGGGVGGDGGHQGAGRGGGGGWSTQWTQKPWSWSWGGGGGDGAPEGGHQVTHHWTPTPPSAIPEEEGAKEDGHVHGQQEEQEQGERKHGGGLMERFCARHPTHPNCGAAGSEKVSNPPSVEWGNGGKSGKEIDDFAAFGWNPATSTPSSSFQSDQQHPFPSSSSSPPFGGRSYLRPSQMDEGVPPEVPSLPFGYLPEEAREAMLKNCKNGVVDCKAQPFGMMQKRTMVLQHEMDFIRKVKPYQSGEMVEKRVELVQQLKQKMLAVAGLDEHIQPVNDGTFQHDVLLTEQQSRELMDALDKVPKRDPSKQHRYGYGHRQKRASLFLDQFSAQRWPIGQSIPYFFDPKIEEFEKQMVRQAHQMIEAQTCIRFQHTESKPSSDFLYYIKVATPTFCGLSYIGHISPANPIYLSFQCQDPAGVAAHETMHALGANHEHLRVDRDEHLDIQWANINPQFYDFFAIADPSKFTTYGVPYAYDSIMHYGPFTASLGTTRPTMVPRENRQQNMGQMGQRKRLSARDVQMLNAMYCKQGCDDSNVFCGIWALRNFCQTPPQMSWMQQNCRKSCNLC